MERIKDKEMASDWDWKVLDEWEIIDMVVSSIEEEKWANLSDKKNTHVWPRELYDWPDEKAKKLKLTKVQYAFIQNYLATGNATQALRDAKGSIGEYDGQQAALMKNNTRINMYIQDTAMECAEIQFEQIIKNPKAPMAVRSQAIIDRLNRAWVWVKEDDTKWNLFVWNMTITIDKWEND